MSELHGKVSREIQQHIFLIGLDRIDKRNAFDSHMIDDLSLALTEYEPYRVCRRPIFLRECPDEKTKIYS